MVIIKTDFSTPLLVWYSLSPPKAGESPRLFDWIKIKPINSKVVIMCKVCNTVFISQVIFLINQKQEIEKRKQAKKFLCAERDKQGVKNLLAANPGNKTR